MTTGMEGVFATLKTFERHISAERADHLQLLLRLRPLALDVVHAARQQTAQNPCEETQEAFSQAVATYDACVEAIATLKDTVGALAARETKGAS